MSFLDKLNRLVQLILNDNSFSIYHALDKESLDKWKKKRFSRWLKRSVVGNFRNFLYFLLLATITGFLVSEALSFYAIDGIITFKTYVKAILTEVCFIFLSAYQSSNKLQAAWVNLLRAGIFSLMLFVISSQTITVGTKNISEIDKIQEQIVLLEEQIEEKNQQLKYYQEKDWPRNYTRTSIEKEELVDKLVDLKEQQIAGKNEDVSKVEEYKMYGKAFFRVLLLLISVLVSRRIFKF